MNEMETALAGGLVSGVVQTAEAGVAAAATGGGFAAIGAAAASAAESAVVADLPAVATSMQSALDRLERRVAALEAAHPAIAAIIGVLAKFFPHELPAAAQKAG